MDVVGIDLSLTSTGVAIISRSRACVTLHRIQTTGTRSDTTGRRHQRLVGIVDQVVQVMSAASSLALVVMEGPAYSRSNPGMHDRSGLWWLLYDTLTRRGALVAEVPPTVRAKYATGRGNAGKDEVLAAVVRRYLDVPVQGNDQADALVLAAMGARHLGIAIDRVPQTHVQAMTKVAWPAPGSRAGVDAA